jgi:predicted acyl esterase
VPDVLVYTSDPLSEDVKVVGPVIAELFVRSNLACADFFARLCDVDGRGRSLNVSDGLIRFRPEPNAASVRRTRIDMWQLDTALDAATDCGSKSQAAPIHASRAISVLANR